MNDRLSALRKHGRATLLAKPKRWYTPYEALKMAIYDNARLVKMCGPRDPYPGEIGVVKEGAWADLILVDGSHWRILISSRIQRKTSSSS